MNELEEHLKTCPICKDGRMCLVRMALIGNIAGMRNDNRQLELFKSVPIDKATRSIKKQVTTR